MEHSHTYSFPIISGCFCTTVAELSSCDRDLWPTKPKIFTIWPFTETNSNEKVQVLEYYRMQGRVGGIFRQNLIIERILQNRTEKNKVGKKSKSSGWEPGPRVWVGTEPETEYSESLLFIFMAESFADSTFFTEGAKTTSKTQLLVFWSVWVDSVNCGEIQRSWQKACWLIPWLGYHSDHPKKSNHVNLFWRRHTII